MVSKKRYIQGFLIIVLAIAIVKEICVGIDRYKVNNETPISPIKVEVKSAQSPQPEVHKPHRIKSVPSFSKAFPDDQPTQLKSAKRYGIKPASTRESLKNQGSKLVYLASNPYYKMDKATRSVPYLVPRAARLLQDIGQNFLDSLEVKGVAPHKPIVTSVLRTQEDVNKLQRYNVNATTNSCHQYATTFDITYNRFQPITPEDPNPEPTYDIRLTQVLAEVLNDLRLEGRCWVKYERKQACFHITVR